MKTVVWCSTRFAALHCWPDAPEEVKYLRSPHRHEFLVRVEWEVRHNDRDIEFITAKAGVVRNIANTLEEEATLTWSCEKWAETILRLSAANKVEVSEDGENGAVVTA